jgi:hypothetical protein
MSFRKIILAAALVLVGASLSSAQAQNGVYTKCKTVNGSIIVVKGSSCPAGTIYVGPG